MRLRKFTKRKSPLTGKPYPQCQALNEWYSSQCTKPVYANDRCYQHFQKLDYVTKRQKVCQ